MGCCRPSKPVPKTLRHQHAEYSSYGVKLIQMSQWRSGSPVLVMSSNRDIQLLRSSVSSQSNSSTEINQHHTLEADLHLESRLRSESYDSECTNQDPGTLINPETLSVNLTEPQPDVNRLVSNKCTKHTYAHISNVTSVAPSNQSTSSDGIIVRECNISVLIEKLTNYAYKWERIGLALGFLPSELNVIKAKPSLFYDAPHSLLRELLNEWVQWTPKTCKGKFATLNDLVHTLQSKTVGLAAVAEEIKEAFEESDALKEVNHVTHNKSHQISENLDCQLIPPDPSAPPIQQYVFYLQSYFTRNTNTDDKWPQIEVREFINLAVVSNEYNDRKDLSEFRMATLHGSIDDIFESKAPISFCDLLKPNCIKGKPYLIQRILIQGAPGIGKSTLCWEICRSWGKKKHFQEYSLVVMLRFRDPWVQKVESVSDLFLFPGEPEMQKAVASEIKRTQGCGLMLILEGFDEAPPSLQDSNSLFLQLFKGLLLPNATVMITTRPSARLSYNLVMCCSGASSRIVEVVGFRKKEIDEYIQSYFGENISERQFFYKYLELYPHIQSMMYIPLNSAIVTNIYQSSIATSKVVPKTMTQLYTALVKTLLLRHMKEIPDYKDIAITNFTDLPSPISNKFLELCKLAYGGITKPERELIFSELPKDFDSLGLMQCVSELYIDVGAASVSYNFLHFTIQEFLAGYHLLQLSEEEQLAFLEEYGSYMPVVSKFLVGLSQQNDSVICKVFEKEVISEEGVFVKVSDLNELHMLFEIQNPCTIAKVYAAELHTLKFSTFGLQNVVPFDFYILGYCIRFSKCNWSIELRGPYYEGDHFEMLKKGMALDINNYSLINGPETRVTHVTLSNPLCLSSNDLVDLISLFSNVQHLEIWYQYYYSGGCQRAHGHAVELINHLPNSLTSFVFHKGIGEKDCKAIGDLLASQRHHIQQLEISLEGTKSSAYATYITPDAVQHIINGLHGNKYLKEFVLCDAILSSSNVSSLAKVLEVNTSLSTLNISISTLIVESCSAASLIIKSLEVNETLRTLTLYKVQFKFINSQQSYSLNFIAPVISDMLVKNEHLLSLCLHNNSLDRDAASRISRALVKNSALQSLDLGMNPIGNKGAFELSEVLKPESKSILKSIDLSFTTIADEGAIAIAKALKNNPYLVTLDLSGNISIGDEGASALAKALESNSKLKNMLLNYNNVNNKGAVALAKALETNLTLEYLGLYRNSIGDKGATAFIEMLPNKCTGANLSPTSIHLQENFITRTDFLFLENSTQKDRFRVWVGPQRYNL